MLAQHAFAHRAELRHRRLAAPVARVDAELDAAEAAGEGVVDQQPLEARG